MDLPTMAPSLGQVVRAQVELSVRRLQLAVDAAAAEFEFVEFVSQVTVGKFSKRDLERMRTALQRATQAAARLNE